MNLVFDLELIARLVLAAFFGYVIGLERELTGHPAGDRTFALTALGAAIFAEISLRAFPVNDSRVAAGVVSGLGFLGAGMILKSSDKEIKGLTTAAGIWTVGAIGLAVGSGLYGLSIVATILALILLASETLLRIDERIQAYRKRRKEAKGEKIAKGKEADPPDRPSE
jgi:putative Mg2+ transporter-C (MgtC) family protein